MLHALRLHDFRSFADSNRIELADVNVFIGPNSAGKSNIMTAIELALLSTGLPAPGPLAIPQVPSFGSFDSILRRSGKSRRSADAEFSLVYEWDHFTARFVLRRSPSSGSTLVHRAEYSPKLLPGKIESIEATDAEATSYRSTDRGRTTAKVTFWGGAPIFYNKNGAVGALLRAGETPQMMAVVRPNRPVPRSVYVLDDPMMHADDSRLISDLLRLWSDDANSDARTTIVENLRTMKLAVDIDARTLGQRKGPRTAEIRVSPRRKSEAATLADVGYGVSQILPLLSHDALSVGDAPSSENPP